MSPRQWLTVRALIIGLWASAGFFSTFRELPLSSAHLVFAFVVGLLGTRFWILRAYKSTGPASTWLAPSWYLNPFQSGQPFQFIHLASASFVLFAVVAVLRRSIEASAPFAAWPTEALAGAFGLGLWAGIWWAVRAYKGSFHSYVQPRA
jgi:hypothetical protein